MSYYESITQPGPSVSCSAITQLISISKSSGAGGPLPQSRRGSRGPGQPEPNLVVLGLHGEQQVLQDTHRE